MIDLTNMLLTVSPIAEWLIKQIPTVVVLGIGVWHQTKQLDKTRDKLDSRAERTIENNTKFAGLIDRLIAEVPSIKSEIKTDLSNLRTDLLRELRELNKT